MTSEDVALLRAILDQPADDTARLVYADWLQENGQEPRASYIRWMCKGRFTHPFPRVSYRAWFQPPWTGETCRKYLLVRDVPSLLLMRIRSVSDERIHRCHITRGFVSQVDLPLDDWLTHGESILAAHPVTQVTLPEFRVEIQPPRIWNTWQLAYYETGTGYHICDSLALETRADMIARLMQDVRDLQSEFA